MSNCRFLLFYFALFASPSYAEEKLITAPVSHERAAIMDAIRLATNWQVKFKVKHLVVARSNDKAIAIADVSDASGNSEDAGIFELESINSQWRALYSVGGGGGADDCETEASIFKKMILKAKEYSASTEVFPSAFWHLVGESKSLNDCLGTVSRQYVAPPSATQACTGELEFMKDSDTFIVENPTSGACRVKPSKTNNGKVAASCHVGSTCTIEGEQVDCEHPGCVQFNSVKTATPVEEAWKSQRTQQCFGTLKQDTSSFLRLIYLYRDGGVACVVADADAEALILKNCRVDEFCVLDSSKTVNCPNVKPNQKEIEAGFVPLAGCTSLEKVIGARTGVKIIKLGSDDSPSTPEADDHVVKSNGSGTSATFEETMNFILTTNKTWSSVNFDGMWSTTITKYDKDNCSADIQTSFGAFPIAKGTLSLSGLKTWKGFPVTVYDGSRNQIQYHYSSLSIESEGIIFQGSFKQANFGSAASLILLATATACSQRCAIAVPSDTDWERMKKAMDYLFAHFCTAGKADPF